MLKSRLVRSSDNREFNSFTGYDGNPVLETESYAAANGTFRSVSRSTAGTTIIVEPAGKDAVVLTDLILTTDKVNNATVTVRITDGTNTIVLLSATVTDAPANLAIPFGGKWEGWQGARVEMVTTGVVKATVALGYFKIKEKQALDYSVWDSKR